MRVQKYSRECTGPATTSSVWVVTISSLAEAWAAGQEEDIAMWELWQLESCHKWIAWRAASDCTLLNDSELIVTRLVSLPKVIIRKQGSWKSRLRTVDGYTLIEAQWDTQFLDRDIIMKINSSCFKVLNGSVMGPFFATSFSQLKIFNPYLFWY